MLSFHNWVYSYDLNYYYYYLITCYLMCILLVIGDYCLHNLELSKASCHHPCFCCCCCSIMLSVQDRHEKWYSQEQEAVDAAESRVNWQMLLAGSVSSPANRSLSSSEWTPLALAAVLLAASSSSLNRSEGSSVTRSGWETPRLTDTGLLCRQPPQRRAVITVCRPLGQGLISRVE